MSNRLRTEILEEEEAERIAAEAAVVEEPVKKVNPENFVSQLFSREFISTEAASNALPFVLFLAFLGMIYIGNMHMAEKNIRDIDKLNKEVKELSWDYKSTKADLAFKSTLSEVKKKADTLGLKEPKEPPQKITVKEDN